MGNQEILLVPAFFGKWPSDLKGKQSVD